MELILMHVKSMKQAAGFKSVTKLLADCAGNIKCQMSISLNKILTCYLYSVVFAKTMNFRTALLKINRGQLLL